MIHHVVATCELNIYTPKKGVIPEMGMVKFIPHPIFQKLSTPLVL